MAREDKESLILTYAAEKLADLKEAEINKAYKEARAALDYRQAVGGMKRQRCFEVINGTLVKVIRGRR